MFRRMILAAFALIVAATVSVAPDAGGTADDSFEWGAKMPTSISASADR
jgi:hypothetical protein